MKITIFGTWYVGLVTGTCLAEVWHEVLCIDINEWKINNLKKWIIPIYEPGLEELVIRNYKNNRLKFSHNPKEWVEFANVIFSAVGTPPDKNHRADLRFVKAVAKTLWENISEYTVFINKSTVPVGTWEICREIIQNKIAKWGRNIDFDIVSNPEFLREWTAVKDFMVPDRIVCGVSSEKAKSIMKQVYEPFSRSYVSMIWTDIPSAEISKYAANSFLATKLSFINEIANFAELCGWNIKDITKAIGSDKRIWSKFLHAGIGYGWSCFPKDVNALIETGKDYNYDFQIIKATESINKAQQLKPVEKLESIMTIDGSIISILWLSFKPKTDDIRDAPSLSIINELLEKWVSQIRVYDPICMPHVKNIFQKETKMIFCDDAYNASQWSDALLIVTEWDEFRGIDKQKILEKMNGTCIIDGRNIWSQKDFENLDGNYQWIWMSHN